MTTEIKGYSATEAAIADLSARYKDVVFDVTKPDGMADAKASYKEINTHSIILEKAREAEKAASLAHGRFVDSEAKRIAEKLDALRLPIKAQIEVETKREARELEEKTRLAQERMIAEDKARKDAEEAKMAADRAEIERRQGELAAAERVARFKIEAEERAARMRIEEADRAARLSREAEEAKLKAERDRIDAERRAVEEVQRKEREKAEAIAKAEREAEEAKQREVIKQKAKHSDACELLKLFVAQYGDLEEFAGIIAAIKIYQSKKE